MTTERRHAPEVDADPSGDGRGGGDAGSGRRVWRALTRPRGSRRWDIYIRTTGVLGLVGIALVHLLPASGPLVGLAIYTLWVSGPLSPLFPVGLEPVVMLLARLHPGWLVALVVTGAGLYVEAVAYHLYGTILHATALERFRESRFVSRSRALFLRAPFFTVWVFSWSPLPFWAVRILGALERYPLRRFLLAATLGRFPKFWLFAVLGVHWSLPWEVLLGAVAAGTAVAAVPWVVGRLRRGAGGEAPTGGGPAGWGSGNPGGPGGGPPGAGRDPHAGGRP